MAPSLKHFTLLVPILVATLAACDAPAEVSAPPGRATPEVDVVTVRKEAVPVTVELPARTSAYRISEVRPQVNGIIKKRLFEEGAAVEAGQVLYQIDAAPYEASLASAKAELQKAQAGASVAQTKVDRYTKLVAVDAVSPQNYDEAQAVLKQSQAQVAAAKAAVDAAEINLAYTTVTSPISGRIGKSAVTEGALVTANQAAPLAVVQQLDPIYVDMAQPAQDLITMRKEIAEGTLLRRRGEEAPVTLLLAGEPFGGTGKLTFADVTVDRGTGTVDLRAVFPNEDGLLMPGLFVKARIEQGVRDDAILIPQRAVTRSPDAKPMVWVVGDDGAVQPRPVETGRAVGDDWVITDGLQGGEQLVVSGFQKIKPGAQVKVKLAEAPVASAAVSAATR